MLYKRGDTIGLGSNGREKSSTSQAGPRIRRRRETLRRRFAQNWHRKTLESCSQRKSPHWGSSWRKTSCRLLSP